MTIRLKPFDAAKYVITEEDQADRLTDALPETYHPAELDSPGPVLAVVHAVCIFGVAFALGMAAGLLIIAMAM